MSDLLTFVLIGFIIAGGVLERVQARQVNKRFERLEGKVLDAKADALAAHRAAIEAECSGRCKSQPKINAVDKIQAAYYKSRAKRAHPSQGAKARYEGSPAVDSGAGSTAFVMGMMGGSYASDSSSSSYSSDSGSSSSCDSSSSSSSSCD